MCRLGLEDISLLESMLILEGANTDRSSMYYTTILTSLIPKGSKVITCIIYTHAHGGEPGEEATNLPGSTKDRHCPLLRSPNDTGREGLTSPSTSSHDSSSSSSRLQACRQESRRRTMFTVVTGAVGGECVCVCVYAVSPVPDESTDNWGYSHPGSPFN